MTMADNDSGYTKKCKHFLMVLNYIKEQIALGQIEARKIYGKLNTADMHTKPLRSAAFLTLAHKILGQPPIATPTLPILSSTSTSSNPPTPLYQDPAENVPILMDTNVESQPSNETKRSLLADSATPNAKRRKAHIDRYITRRPGFVNDADV